MTYLKPPPTLKNASLPPLRRSQNPPPAPPILHRHPSHSQHSKFSNFSVNLYPIQVPLLDFATRKLRSPAGASIAIFAASFAFPIVTLQ
ncbi:hypothetical protein L218DRAFT_706757 [Marasmius fiardii PR-910]|nr:hypothetical protein L218DRAFT_706757 [Marasmius fiardii PR-910]